ncbi:MAG: PAC2 family protein [Candidatus Planktophila sp.]|nr:PAC2 family protein [Candidatus Planktophila sp.]
MSHVEIYEIPALRSPIMVIAFGGWSDAGEAATGVITHLLSELGSSDAEDIDNGKSTLIGEVDSEDYYDFQVNRPLIFVDSSMIRSLTWPGVQVFGVRNPDGERDFVLIRGVEPSMRWRTFASEILDLAEDLEVELVITLGSMLADTPHTRAIPISGTGAHPDIATRLGVEVSRYEGPTGILAVIQDGCVRRGIDAIALWAAVPHYANATPSPKATLALVNGLEDFLEISLPQGELPEKALAWEAAVNEMVKEDSDIEEYIKTLEESKDANEISDDSGEELAREVERFLRRQNNSNEN